MISTKQPMLDDVKQDSTTTDDKKPLLKCTGCKKLFKTTEDLERHSVLNCRNIKPSGNYSHYDKWDKRQKHRSNHAIYIGSDMNSKEYFDQMLDSDSESSESSINSDIASRFDKLVDEAIPTGSDEDDIARVNAWVEASIPQEKPEWYHMPDVSTPKTSDETTKKEPPKPEPTYSCNQCKQSFHNEVLLKNHQNFEKRQSIHQCNECHKSFKYRRNLHKHMSKECVHKHKTIKQKQKTKQKQMKGTQINITKKSDKQAL